MNRQVMTLETIYSTVQEAWEEYDRESLESVFQELQLVHQKVIDCQGNNNYKLPRNPSTFFHRQSKNNMRSTLAKNFNKH